MYSLTAYMCVYGSSTVVYNPCFEEAVYVCGLKAINNLFLTAVSVHSTWLQMPCVLRQRLLIMIIMTGTDMADTTFVMGDR